MQGPAGTQGASGRFDTSGRFSTYRLEHSSTRNVHIRYVTPLPLGHIDQVLEIPPVADVAFCKNHSPSVGSAFQECFCVGREAQVCDDDSCPLFRCGEADECQADAWEGGR